MITSEKYIILDDIPNEVYISTKLCILNFDILPVIDKTNELITHNPDTVFWLATKDFSKNYIKAASRLGIKNVIPLPIKTELINNFFVGMDNFEKQEENIYDYAPLNNSKILIVDDNVMNIKLLTEILNNLGIEITTCTSPFECLEIIDKFKFDLFLLDILMPEMSGFELAEKIKQSPKNSITPIIFISAISGTENKMNGYNLGACSYIEKPFHPNILKAQIYNILKIEEEKQIEERNKESFVATLTHDLKSPINAEINALKYLLKDDKKELTAIKNEMLSEMLNSAKYMKLITDKILCHYKQKNNTITLNKEQASLREIIISSIEEMKYLASDKNLKIRFYTETDSDSAKIDKIEIKRVINNLLSNAVEYSFKDNFIDITLSQLNDSYIVTVKDYGVGIDLKKYECVFDEYVSLSKEHKKIGFGLGLSICKKIINAHGGEINISSEPEEGTTITFSIPTGQV